MALDVIEPCGFPWKARDIDRVALDYGPLARPVRHRSFAAFREHLPGRLILLTTKADPIVWDLPFAGTDTLLMGRESSGVPDAVRAAADHAVRVPMAPGARSLNIVTAAAIALGEACRQSRQSP